MIVIGLSSGTSADGIDIAAGDFARERDTVRLTPLGHRTVDYSPQLHRAIRDVLPPAATSVDSLCRIDTGIGQEFAAAAKRGLDELTHGEAELLASHGQTLFHWVTDSTVHGTLQLGQPAWIAEATGLPVVSDMRVADIAAGGQGAPLAGLLDTLLLGAHAKPAAALNLGGISNVTIVREDAPPVAFDTGPANALIDAAVARVTDGGQHTDTDGALAARGYVDRALLDVLLAEPYYRLAPPKSTGKELFHAGYLDAALNRVGEVHAEDLVATLVELSSITIADALLPYGIIEVLISGGGIRNPVLRSRLADRLSPARITATDELGLDSDAKEAYLFALLGFFTWHGLAGSLPSCTGATRAPIAGRITPGAGPLRLPEPATTFPSSLRIDAPRS